MEYDYSSESKCETCESGYLVDSSYKCDICDDGYIQIADKPVICAKEVANCEKYDLADGDWICISCNLGYELYESQYCIEVIECCLEYIMINNTAYCSECDSNIILNCYPCDYGMACLCMKGFYFSADYSCKACPDHCKNCKLEDEKIICIECESDYILDESDCILYEEDVISSPIIANSAQAVQGTVILTSATSLATMDFDNILSLIGTIHIINNSLLYDLDISERAAAVFQGLSIFKNIPNIFKYMTHDRKTLEDERYDRIGIRNELFLINSGKSLTIFLGLILLIILLRGIRKRIRHLS